MRQRSALAAIAIVLGMTARARADEQPPPPAVPVTKVALQERPELAKNGKVALYRGEADGQGVAFYIDGLGIATPVGVMLMSGDKSAPMRLSAKNDLSAKWDKELPAGAGGTTKLQFTTEGPAMLLVRGPAGTDKKPYQIAIWVGPEVRLDKLLPPPFGKGAAAKGGGSSIAPFVVIPIVGVVLLIVIISVVRRRKKGAAR